VNWSGTDDAGGSGVAAYDAFVSTDGGPFTPFQSATTATSAVFAGQDGHTYAFYTVASDNVGNRQATPTTAQASTRLTLPPNAVATATAVQSSKNPARPGDPVTFTATVTAASGTARPTGTVQFLIDGAPTGPAVGLDNGTVTGGAVAGLATGTHVVAARYVNADGLFLNSTGPLAAGQVVSPSAGLSAATVTLTPNLANPVYGQPLSFAATVGATGTGQPVPAGTVQFLVDGANLGTTVALVNGVATSTGLAALGAGPHTVSAAYSGDTFFNAVSSDPQSVTVARAPLTVTADSKARLYGSAMPGLTYTLVGFVNSDAIGAVSGKASLTSRLLADLHHDFKRSDVIVAHHGLASRSA